ncbi:hypothetical protein HY025_05735 [Candidatus Daviesbacteria bacterium]|nr:hypothetical protein [Candidatus Daviesbacteria bacterium]
MAQGFPEMSGSRVFVDALAAAYRGERMFGPLQRRSKPPFIRLNSHQIEQIAGFVGTITALSLVAKHPNKDRLEFLIPRVVEGWNVGVYAARTIEGLMYPPTT